MSLITRHILIELLKVMALTCSVLVTVIAFGAAVRPLAEDLLGPLDTVKYIFLASVPMLQFALPFAAGFASTMVLHRMANDNELLALSTSGLSYRRIFTPVGWLAVLLAVTMLLLVNFAVPRFWMLMRATVASDVTRIFVNRISQGSAFEAGDLQIFADAVASDAPAPGSGASGRLHLAGVAAVQLDAAGVPTTEFTAELATVDIYRDADGTFLKPSLLNATIFRAEDGTLAFMPRAAPEAVRLADPMRRSPKFMTFTEIMRLRKDREAFPSVRLPRTRLEQTFREAETWQLVARTLAGGQAFVLKDPLGRSSYVIEADRLDGRRLRPAPGGTIRITELVEGRAVRIAETADASLVAVFVGRDGEQVALDLLVGEARVRQLGDGRAGTPRWPPRLSALRLSSEPGAGLSDEPTESLVRRSAELLSHPGPASELHARALRQIEEIENAKREVGHEIAARLAQRLAVSVAAPLVLLLGAVLAAWRRNALPLAIYAVAFLPSIADILLIAGGEQMMKTGRIGVGLAVMWSGNLFLGAFIFHAWRRMARN